MEMAKLRNPHLAAMIPQADGGSDRYFGLINGGAIELASGSGWMRHEGSKVFPKFSPELPHDEFVQAAKYFNLHPVLPDVDFQKAWRELPLVDIVKMTGAPPSDWEAVVSHAPSDSWWDHFGYVKPSDHFNVPALQVNSWYDIAIGDTVRMYNQMRTNSDSNLARDNQFLIVSPTSHCLSELATDHTKVGELDLGDAQLPYYTIYLRWFDHWLKGEDNGVTSMPKVQFYTMGKNEWRSADQWPPEGTRFTKYYLHSDGHSNSRFGTGILTIAEPGDEASDRYTYDPSTPVPTLGGPLCCTGTRDAVPGAYDQSELETREDVLVYTTPVLKQGVEVTGPLQVVLYASSSVPDTDFTAKLVDVHSDGKAYNIQDGILRARYRQGYDKPTLMEPSGVYELTIDLQATSNYFAAGHRIRLEISSSNFPRFDRNLNTGGNNYGETKWQVANNEIHHAKAHASYLLLPVSP
jgi:putative CocE/NonD family hydrolase